jgi:prepilin-type N-terminal cleavage/methylation domain-containing protein
LDSVKKQHKYHKPFCRRLRAESGFTLIELIATLAILGFVIAALYTFYLSALYSWNNSIDRMEQQQSTRIAVDKIIKELRYAHEAEIRYDDQSMIYFRIYIDGRSTLHRFRCSGGQLLFERRRDNDTHYAYNVIALGITNLIFSVDGNNTVFINIQSSEGSRILTLTGCVRPLNIPAVIINND